MRPQGEVRQAVVSCIEAQPGTLREIVQRANVGYDSARWVLKDAVRSGQIAKSGMRRDPHSKRPVVVYGMALIADPGQWLGVDDAISTWAR